MWTRRETVCGEVSNAKTRLLMSRLYLESRSPFARCARGGSCHSAGRLKTQMAWARGTLSDPEWESTLAGVYLLSSDRRARDRHPVGKADEGRPTPPCFATWPPAAARRACANLWGQSLCGTAAIDSEDAAALIGGHGSATTELGRRSGPPAD